MVESIMEYNVKKRLDSPHRNLGKVLLVIGLIVGVMVFVGYFVIGMAYKDALVTGDYGTVRICIWLRPGLVHATNQGPGIIKYEPAIVVASTNDTLAHNQIVKLLLERGANPNAVGTVGSPLTLMARHGNTEMVRYLLTHGADVNTHVICSTLRETVLTTAVESGNLEVVKVMVDAGADIDPPSIERDYYSPLFCTTLGQWKMSEWPRRQAIMEYLVVHGAKIDFTSTNAKNIYAIRVWLDEDSVFTKKLNEEEKRKLVEVLQAAFERRIGCAITQPGHSLPVTTAIKYAYGTEGVIMGKYLSNGEKVD